MANLITNLGSNISLGSFSVVCFPGWLFCKMVYFKGTFPLSVVGIRVKRNTILNAIIWPNLISPIHLTANINLTANNSFDCKYYNPV